MVYLNAPEAGGATEFPALDLTRSHPNRGCWSYGTTWIAVVGPTPARGMLRYPEARNTAKCVVTQWYRQGEWSLARPRD